MEDQKRREKSGKTSRNGDSEVETLKEQILRDAEIVAKWNKLPFYII